MEIVILILSLGAFVGIIVWAVKYTKKINKRKIQFFSDFANKHNLQHTSNKYMLVMLNSVKGDYKGCQFEIYEQMQGSGKNKQVVTYVNFRNTPFDFDFKIGKEHIFSKTGKLLGMKDIEFGDAEFDKKFLIKSKEEDKFRSFFNFKLQEELRQIGSDLKSSIHAKDGTLSYYNYGPLPNQKQFDSFERVVGFMFKLIDEKS
ncbi:MAG: hypothetical protein R2780_05290 [Crocinitomicaceae bacterium]|nr:hypothetical protein [Crocinitomicaceae bacterium]